MQISLKYQNTTDVTNHLQLLPLRHGTDPSPYPHGPAKKPTFPLNVAELPPPPPITSHHSPSQPRPSAQSISPSHPSPISDLPRPILYAPEASASPIQSFKLSPLGPLAILPPGRWKWLVSTGMDEVRLEAWLVRVCNLLYPLSLALLVVAYSYTSTHSRRRLATAQHRRITQCTAATSARSSLTSSSRSSPARRRHRSGNATA